jgi:hypothetical protein
LKALAQLEDGVAGDRKQRSKQGLVTEFLQMRNWFVNAALTLVIYGATWYYLYRYSTARLDAADQTMLGYFLYRVIHVLPLLALVMVVMGFIERRQKAVDDRERKRIRYEATMELNRLQREDREVRGGRKPS